MAEEKKRVLILESNYQYDKMFREEGWASTLNIQDADLIQFTGGSDVSPYLYGHHVHKTTGNDKFRDVAEQRIYEQALERGIPMAGICRGGQFLHVMNGGAMFQNVNNHTRAHTATIVGTNIDIVVSSTHHQMMMQTDQTKDDGIVLMVAHESSRKEYMTLEGDVKRDVTRVINAATAEDDLESIYYPDTNCLCFQPHPEFGGMDNSNLTDVYGNMREAYFAFIANYLFPTPEV